MYFDLSKIKDNNFNNYIKNIKYEIHRLTSIGKKYITGDTTVSFKLLHCYDVEKEISSASLRCNKTTSVKGRFTPVSETIEDRLDEKYYNRIYVDRLIKSAYMLTKRQLVGIDFDKLIWARQYEHNLERVLIKNQLQIRLLPNIVFDDKHVISITVIII